MAQKVAPIPKGFRTATPCLIVNGVDQAVDFYTQAFNAITLNVTNDPSDCYAIHASIKIGNSIIVLQQESAELGILSPVTTGSCGSQTHLYVKDVDAAWEIAITAGGVPISPPMDTYWGDRSSTLVDPFGHRWSLASRVEHVSRVDIQKRSAALYMPQVSEEINQEALA